MVKHAFNGLKYNVSYDSNIVGKTMSKKFGHYEVIAELGRGGMGVVYKAWEPSLNRHVAIKALGEHLLNDKDLIERFKREAKSMAAINHPNVIQVYFIGEQDGQPYFAMEFIRGMSLDELLKGGKALTVQHAKEILRQSCAGLSVAHAADLVHRDIKPANLMICEDGSVKVVDFGIAQTREFGDKLTNTGEFVGTPGYLSPEVCTGQDVDSRSDIFALGIVFYEMLAGKVPFENDSPLGLMLEVVQAEIPDIRNVNKKVDKKTHYILEKMIAKNPEERFQHCSDIMAQLGPGSIDLDIDEMKSQAVTVAPVASKKPISEQSTLPNAATLPNNAATLDRQKAAQKKSSNKGMWAMVFAVVALGAGAVGVHEGYIPWPFGEEEQPSQAMTLLSNQDKEPLALADVPLKESSGSTQDQDQPTTHDGEPDGVSDELPFEPIVIGGNSGDKNKQTEDGFNPISISGKTKPKNNDDSVKTNVIDRSIAAIDKKDLPVEKHSSVEQPIVKTKPIAKPKNKGIAVLVFGDPAVANPVEKIIEAEFKQAGIKVLNEQFVPGLSNSMRGGIDLALIREKLDSYGGQAMVIANVNHVGEQQLEYYGRQSTLINAQLDVDAYDLSSGDSIGQGYGRKISYTSLNATDNATEAVMGFVGQLAEDIKKR